MQAPSAGSPRGPATMGALAGRNRLVASGRGEALVGGCGSGVRASWTFPRDACLQSPAAATSSPVGVRPLGWPAGWRVHFYREATCRLTQCRGGRHECNLGQPRRASMSSPLHRPSPGLLAALASSTRATASRLPMPARARGRLPGEGTATPERGSAWTANPANVPADGCSRSGRGRDPHTGQDEGVLPPTLGKPPHKSRQPSSFSSSPALLQPCSPDLWCWPPWPSCPYWADTSRKAPTTMNAGTAKVPRHAKPYVPRAYPESGPSQCSVGQAGEEVPAGPPVQTPPLTRLSSLSAAREPGTDGGHLGGNTCINIEQTRQSIWRL